MPGAVGADLGPQETEIHVGGDVGTARESQGVDLAVTMMMKRTMI